MGARGRPSLIPLPPLYSTVRTDFILCFFGFLYIIIVQTMRVDAADARGQFLHLDGRPDNLLDLDRRPDQLTP